MPFQEEAIPGSGGFFGGYKYDKGQQDFGYPELCRSYLMIVQ